MEDAGQLQISLLGPCASTSGGVPLDLGGPRQRAVLAVLVLSRGEMVPADRLTESVWGERAPADPAGALQACVSHLRRRLQPAVPPAPGAGVIVSEGRGWAVRLPPDAVSARRSYGERILARLRQVVDTYDPQGVLQAGAYTRAIG